MVAAAKPVRPSAARRAASGLKAAQRPSLRVQGAQATRDSLLKAATKVFAKYGYEGGSVEKISTAAKSYDRMIYYYFGSKEGLFIEVLEDMYRRMNEAESKLALDVTQPVAALRAVIRVVIGYYRKNPEFVTLLNTENLHKGKHIAKSLRAQDYSSPAIAVIAVILQNGATQRQFRPNVQARDVYLMIAAMGYFHMSNRHTLSAFLGENLEAPDAIAHWEVFVTEAVMRLVSP